MPEREGDCWSVNFTVGKIEEGVAVLVSDDLRTVEFPSECLPLHNGPIGVGSVISLQLDRNSSAESARLDEFYRLQNDILAKYGQAPSEEIIGACLKVDLCTHSSVMAVWPSWNQLCKQNGWMARLHSLDCYCNESVIFSGIDADETTVRITGLEPGKQFEMYLRFRTTAGSYRSNTVRLGTRSENDLSGLHLLVYLEEPDGVVAMAQEMGATLCEDATPIERVSHIISSGISRVPADLLFKAQEASTPIVTPEWLEACRDAGQLLPTHKYYLT